MPHSNRKKKQKKKKQQQASPPQSSHRDQDASSVPPGVGDPAEDNPADQSPAACFGATATAASPEIPPGSVVGLVGDVNAPVKSIIAGHTVHHGDSHHVSIPAGGTASVGPSKSKQKVKLQNVLHSEVTVGQKFVVQGDLHQHITLPTAQGSGDLVQCISSIMESCTDVCRSKNVAVDMVSYAFLGENKYHFEAVSGRPLFEYLQSHPDKFKVTKVGSEWFVSLQPVTAKDTAEVVGKVLHAPCIPERAASMAQGAIPKAGLAQTPKKTVPLADDSEESCGQQKESTSGSDESISPSGDSPKQTRSPVDKIFEEARFFKRGHYVLITGSAAKHITNLAGVSNVPWQIVFDFDEMSRQEGLLSKVETFMERKRPLHILDWTDRNIKTIRDNGTIWYFAKGWIDNPDSRVEEYRKWKTKAVKALDNLLNELACFTFGYGALTVLILWDSNFGQYLSLAACRLSEKLGDAANILVCVDKDSVEEEDLKTLQKEIEMKRINVSFENLFQALASRVQMKPVVSNTEFKLPTADKSNDPGIDSVLAAQLAEDLDVFYVTNPEKEVLDSDELQAVARKFLSGETLSWKNRWDFDNDPIDVKRELYSEILTKMKSDYLDQGGMYAKVATFTLHHAPGAGGTTLAQRVMWKLKDYYPCVQVHFGRGPIKEIATKIDRIYSLTHLPVVCMMDGEDGQRIQQLKRYLQEGVYVFFSVERCRKLRSNKTRDFYLDGYPTPKEAPHLSKKFESYCTNPSQVNALKKMCREIVRGLQDHHLFEFGLTAFQHEFKGIKSFVREYLEMDEKSQTRTRDQTILAYLSLVHYYGQTYIPCQLFMELLERERNDYICLEDFSDNVRMLVVQNDEHGHTIRICHSLVAQEILEQVLTWGSSPEKRTEDLSQAARKNLCTLALEFIDYASREVKGIYNRNSSITSILTRTFIIRNNFDPGSSGFQKKPKLSRLLMDLHFRSPYDEQLSVLKQLTTKFPQEPNFLAHLGRFYSIFRPNEEKEAEQAFDEALTLCYRKVNKTEEDDVSEIEESVRSTLMHVYHMYGMIYRQRIGKFTGRFFDERPQIGIDKAPFPEKVVELVNMAEKACGLFERVRKVTLPGQEEGLYGYNGEIHVRLQICDYVHRYNPASKNLGEYVTAAENDPYWYTVQHFIQESILVIDELFLELSGLVDDEFKQTETQSLIRWHLALLGGKAKVDVVYDLLNLEDDMKTRRLKVATKKLMYSKENCIAVIDLVTSGTDLLEIVGCYEKNFHDVHTAGFETSKRLLNTDYREWLVAIRHPAFPKTYSVQAVLRHIMEWDSYCQGAYSVYYSFILNSMLGFGDQMRDGFPENLHSALAQMDLMKRTFSWTITRPRLPREWLGCSEIGIKNLIPGSRFTGQIEGRTFRPNQLADRLMRCRGTICKPNRSPLKGYISLDLGPRNYTKVEVFYVPITAHPPLVGEFYADSRVEFVLGFTFDHGYEAYEVYQLRKAQCRRCSTMTEISQKQRSIKCPRCKHPIASEFPTWNVYTPVTEPS